jgi:phosphate/sulfate permease
MAIGLASLVFGVLTLGKRYLHKYRKKFMRTTLANGMIINTSASIILLLCSLLGYPCSCTYLIVPNIFMMNRLRTNRPFLDNKKKMLLIAVFFFIIILSSAGLATLIYEFITYISKSSD